MKTARNTRRINTLHDAQLALDEVWKAIDELSQMVPPGTIMAMIRPEKDTAPPGWIAAEGQQNISVLDNRGLTQVLGKRYGGDGATVIGIPDLRARVIKGQDTDLHTTKRVGTVTTMSIAAGLMLFFARLFTRGT